MSKKEKVSVLILGQTPPPYVGQFVLIEQIVNTSFDRINLHHVKMAFSDDVENVGRFKLKKVFHLVALIFKVWFVAFKYKPDILYYPPSGPNMVPIVRDIILLCFIRPFFKRTVFHFHASGVSEVVDSLPWYILFFYKKAYFYSRLGIHTSETAVNDSYFLKAERSIVIPNGVKDEFINTVDNTRQENDQIILLYVGMLHEGKGLFVLLDACEILINKGLNFKLKLVGDFYDQDTKAKARAHISKKGLESFIVFEGVLTGREKWEAYASADIFCFPSFYESESFGLVAVEAMSFKLPVVATRWRGLSSIVRDNETGYLVDIKDSESLAKKIEILINQPQLRKEMGQKGRKDFLKHYSDEEFHKRIEQALVECL